jgi:hypothetical protein
MKTGSRGRIAQEECRATWNITDQELTQIAATTFSAQTATFNMKVKDLRHENEILTILLYS